MKTTILRSLIREVITATSSTSAAPSTSTAPDSKPSDKDDGGDDTVIKPEAAIERYFSNTKNATDIKRGEEIKKLADTLKQNNVSSESDIMNKLKVLDRDEDGGQSFAQQIVNQQKS
jgi:hypothetical protein